jgi:hypothetical protein
MAAKGPREGRKRVSQRARELIHPPKTHTVYPKLTLPGRVPEWSNGADCKSVAQASWVRIPPRPFLSPFLNSSLQQPIKPLAGRFMH